MNCENGVCEINFAEDSTPIPEMSLAEAKNVLAHYKYLANITKPNLPSTIEFCAAVNIALTCMELCDRQYHITEQLNESNTRER